MGKEFRYIVEVSPRSTIMKFAPNATSAKSRVWAEIKDGYTYGFDNRKAFMKGATAHKE